MIYFIIIVNHFFLSRIVNCELSKIGKMFNREQKRHKCINTFIHIRLIVFYVQRSLLATDTVNEIKS